MRVRRQLILFCLGGVIGFIVDAGVLQLLVSGLAWERPTPVVSGVWTPSFSSSDLRPPISGAT